MFINRSEEAVLCVQQRYGMRRERLRGRGSLAPVNQLFRVREAMMRWTETASQVLDVYGIVGCRRRHVLCVQ